VSAGTLRLSGSGSSLGMSTNTLTLAGGTLDLVNKALSLSALTMNSSSSSIINSSGTSSLIVLNASLLRGSITTQGTQTYSNGITLTGNMTFASSNNDITFSSTISGAYNLTINSGTGLTRFNGALSNINNPYSQPSSIIFSLNPKVAVGQQITESPPTFMWNKMIDGTYNDLRLSLLGTDLQPLIINDPNMTILMTIADKDEI
jgi:hypothetical protein